MIQLATVPAAAKLLLAMESQTSNGDAAAFDPQFSALIAAKLSTPDDVAPDKAEAAPVPELPFKTEVPPASAKTTGKADGKGGKLLPDSPALAAFAAMLKQLRGAGKTGDDAIPAQEDKAPAGREVAYQLPAPAFAVPATTNSAQVPAAAANDIAPPSLIARPAQTADIATGQIQPFATASFRQTTLSAPIEPPSGGPAREPGPAAPDQTDPATIESARAYRVAVGGLAFVESHDFTPDQPAAAKAIGAVGPAQELPQSRPELQPLVIQSGLTTRVLLVPRSLAYPGELAKLQTMAIEQGKTGDAGLEIAKVQVRQAPEDHASRTVPAIAPVSAENPAAASELARNRSVAEITTEAPQKASRPEIVQDAVPFPAADPAASLSAAPAGATSPAPAPAPSRTPDFAALIDRLVEARAAAQASLEPRTVSAAIQHADFGEVSLQFRQDATGLSVVMASADPDLAKALQIAAPSGGSFSGQFAGQFGSSGEGNAPSPRHDTAGQQSGGQASAFASQAQSQAQQHRSQTPQRAQDQTFSAANPSSRSRGEANHPARSGIFA